MPNPRDTLRQVETDIQALGQELENRLNILQERLDNTLASQFIANAKKQLELNPLVSEIQTIALKPQNGEDLSKLTLYDKTVRQIQTVLETTDQYIEDIKKYIDTTNPQWLQSIDLGTQEILQAIAISKAELKDLQSEIVQIRTEMKKEGSPDNQALESQRKEKELIQETKIQYLEGFQLQLETLKKKRADSFRDLENARSDLKNSKTKQQQLTTLSTQLNGEHQKKQKEIDKINELHAGLIDETDEILKIDNFATAEQKLTDIHKKTAALAAAVNEAAKKRVETLHQRRLDALNEIKKENTDFSKRPIIHLQETLASFSQTAGVIIKPKDNQENSEEEINKILKTAKTYHSFTYAGMEFYRHSNGAIQAIKNTPIRAKLMIDFELKELANNQMPLDLEISSGCASIRNIAAKHALAMGANDVTIVNPDEIGEKWNEIFNVNKKLKPEKFLSGEAQSRFTLLIKALHIKHGDKASAPLIRGVLSAFSEDSKDSANIAKILNDLAYIKDAQTSKIVMDQLPSILSAMTNEARQKIFSELKDPAIQVKLLEAYYQYQQKDLGTKLFGWMTTPKTPAYIAEIIEGLDENSCNQLKAELKNSALGQKFPELAQVIPAVVLAA